MKRSLAAALAVFPIVVAVATPYGADDYVIDGLDFVFANFFSEKTSLVYTCLPKYVQKADFFTDGLRIWRREGDYGYGMEDCAIIHGVALSALCDEYEVTGRETAREDARRLVRGLLNLVSVHPYKGYVARGLCEEDGKSICALTSRDQFTHWVHGLWRYRHSPLFDTAFEEEMKTAFHDVADRMQRTVTEENGWSYGQADGTPDPRGITKMRQVEPHEAARLAMIYAAAWDITRELQWRDLWRELIDEAVEESRKLRGKGAGWLAGMMNYALFQMNVSLELLLAMETDSVLRAGIAEAMTMAAETAREHAASVGTGDGPFLCSCAELALAQMMAPDFDFSAAGRRIVVDSVAAKPLTAVATGSTRIIHVSAAWWRLRRTGWVPGPMVSGISVSRDERTRSVTVDYELVDEPAVITLSVQTNRGDGVWADVGDANLSHAVGDVNVRVGPGAHAFKWYPDRAWPGKWFDKGASRIGVKVWAIDAPPDYMVVSLDIPSNVTYYTSAEAVPGGVKDVRYKTSHLLMRKIPARGVVWQMGSPREEDASREADYETLRNVTLSEDYYMGVYELTQGQFMRINGSYWTCGYDGEDKDVHPQERVGRDAFRGAGASYRWPQDGHAVDPAKRIAKLRKKTGIMFDLPTSAQWEYACRAGRSGKWGTDTLGKGGWYLDNGGSKTHEVGLKDPNDWGLYDVHGNVGEITLDVYGKISSAGSAIVTNPTGPDEPGEKHVVRGGSYAEQAWECRAARQRGLDESGSASYKDYIGFRICAPVR